MVAGTMPIPAVVVGVAAVATMTPRARHLHRIASLTPPPVIVVLPAIMMTGALWRPLTPTAELLRRLLTMIAAVVATMPTVVAVETTVATAAAGVEVVDAAGNLGSVVGSTLFFCDDPAGTALLADYLKEKLLYFFLACGLTRGVSLLMKAAIWSCERMAPRWLGYPAS